MSELLSQLGREQLTTIICLGIAATVAIVAIIAGVWCHWRKAEMEASLKAELIKQGRSVDEIERVLRASSRTDEDRSLQQKVIKMALKEGKSTEEIDRLLRSV
jgi:sensor histidine kinase regulating citrate/malate metabolism